MHHTLEKYLPKKAVAPCSALITDNKVHFKIVNKRITRHGDYRISPKGIHMITVNASLNKYRFLITFIHEIAHLIAFKKYGRGIKPHGLEWKRTFQHLILPFIRPEIFPLKLLPILADHFKNPKASSDTDVVLSIALKQFDTKSDKTYIYQIPAGSIFRIYNGKLFKKGGKRTKRYECIEMTTLKTYLFQPNAEIELIKE